MSNWIKWNGGECPVQQNTPVDVRYRDGQEKFNVPALKNVPGREASSAYWKHSNYVNDIVAYRLSEVDNLQSRVNDEKLAHSAGYATWDEFEQARNEDMRAEFDTVQRPAHYNQSGIECIDAIAASMTPEEFQAYLKGNVQKYLWRYQHKNGVEDCRKAQWYLDRLVKELSK